MKSTIRSVVASSLLIFTAADPLIVRAETIVFDGRDAFGYMNGYSNAGVYMSVRAFESVTRSQLESEKSAGAHIYGRANCERGVGSTNSIELDAFGPIPRKVVASGGAEVTWYNWCTGGSHTEEVAFNMDLSAMTDQISSSNGTDHYDYGEFKVNSHYNDVQAPATVNSLSYISSPRFGLVTPSYASVGHSKEHEVQIIKP